MEKIVKTINHLSDEFHHIKKSASDGFPRIKQSTGDEFHQMKKVLMGKDQSVATQQFQGNSSYIGRLLFAHKLNI